MKTLYKSKIKPNAKSGFRMIFDRSGNLMRADKGYRHEFTNISGNIIYATTSDEIFTFVELEDTLEDAIKAAKMFLPKNDSFVAGQNNPYYKDGIGEKYYKYRSDIEALKKYRK